MPSNDAFMELSDPDVWGESYDEQFKGRHLGAFEISKFDFDISTDEDVAKKAAGSTTGPTSGPTTGPTAGAPSGKHKELNKGTFSITKYIDKASPDLFLCCLKKTKMKWGIVSVRESGETKGIPFLVLEFQGLTVSSFKWDLTPGESGEGSASMESVGFEYEKVLIKYARQEREGHHHPVKMKGWDFNNHNEQVQEIPWNQLQPEASATSSPDD
jgi:type VI secretion system secreted protein Hcp